MCTERLRAFPWRNRRVVWCSTKSGITIPRTAIFFNSMIQPFEEEDWKWTKNQSTDNKTSNNITQFNTQKFKNRKNFILKIFLETSPITPYIIHCGAKFKMLKSTVVKGLSQRVVNNDVQLFPTKRSLFKSKGVRWKNLFDARHLETRTVLDQNVFEQEAWKVIFSLDNVTTVSANL